MDEAQARQVTLLGVNGYYYWDEARRDREDAFVRAGLPMLVLQGGQDRQVYADRDFPLWQAFAAGASGYGRDAAAVRGAGAQLYQRRRA